MRTLIANRFVIAWFLLCGVTALLSPETGNSQPVTLKSSQLRHMLHLLETEHKPQEVAHLLKVALADARTP